MVKWVYLKFSRCKSKDYLDDSQKKTQKSFVSGKK